MPRTLIRYEDGTGPKWAVQFGDRLTPIAVQAPTTGELLAKHWDAIWDAREEDASEPISRVSILPPVTVNQQFLCQGVNYRSHVDESGMKVEDIGFNMLFTKSPASITSADAPVSRPPSVHMLDYEIELGLVLRRDLPKDARVSPHDLGEWLAGVTIVNDLSARDIQLPQGQFYKGKSFRGFGPVGPGIVLLRGEEWKRWPQLRMRLSVNNELRQSAYCGEMIHQPASTLSELASLHDVNAGDLIATGTPAGCAARAPGKATMFIARHFMNDAAKWRMFVASGRKNPKYLQPGDRINATIRTDDGEIDLGEQTTNIVHSEHD